MASWVDLDGAARLLASPKESVTRWVRQGLIPCRGILPAVRFEREALERFAREQGLTRRAFSLGEAEWERDLLAGALSRGAIGRGRAQSAAEAIRLAIEQIADLSEEARSELLGEVLARERLASTALGGRVAMPHPRRPPGRWIQEPRVSLLTLEEPIDWAAPDGERVGTIFLLLSPSVAVHLELLARLSLALHSRPFRALLDRGAEREELLQLLVELKRED